MYDLNIPQNTISLEIYQELIDNGIKTIAVTVKSDGNLNKIKSVPKEIGTVPDDIKVLSRLHIIMDNPQYNYSIVF